LSPTPFFAVAGLPSRSLHGELQRENPCLGQPNAQVQQRGQPHRQPLTEPPRWEAPLAPRLLQPLVAPPVFKSVIVLE
jgi:hypothetical protein